MYIIELYRYYEKNNMNDRSLIIDLLWQKGFVKILQELLNIDISRFENIIEINKKL